MMAAVILTFGNLHFQSHERVLNWNCNIPTQFGNDWSTSKDCNSLSNFKMEATVNLKSTLSVEPPLREMNS